MSAASRRQVCFERCSDWLHMAYQQLQTPKHARFRQWLSPGRQTPGVFKAGIIFRTFNLPKYLSTILIRVLLQNITTCFHAIFKYSLNENWGKGVRFHRNVGTDGKWDGLIYLNGNWVGNTDNTGGINTTASLRFLFLYK